MKVFFERLMYFRTTSGGIARIPQNTTKGYVTIIETIEKQEISLSDFSIVVWIVQQHKTEASGLRSNENKK